MTSDGTPWRPLVHGLNICRAIIDGSDVFRAKLRFRVFLIRELTRGTRNRMHPAGEFFQQTVPRRVSIGTIRQIFEQCRQILNSREAIKSLAPAALGG